MFSGGRSEARVKVREVSLTWLSPWTTLGYEAHGDRRRAGRLLAASSVGLIVALTYVRIAGGPHAVELALQAMLVVAFGLLTIIDFRTAVAITLLELTVAGSSGQWTQFPGGIHGRIVLYGLVILTASIHVLIQFRRTGRLGLGSYGIHAIALAVLMPVVWMTLGLLNGNDPRDVFADGNGQLFFAFAIPILVLMNAGQAGWLRRWMIVATATNGLIFLGLIAVSVPGFVPLSTLSEILHYNLYVGNSIGYLPNGAYRLYLASGLYLQVGLALATWEILEGPRRLWPWAFFTTLIVAEVATYTRGFWLGALVAVGVAAVVGAPSIRRLMMFTAGSVLVLTLLTGGAWLIGFSLPDYILERSGSAVPTAPGGLAPAVPENPDDRVVPVPSLISGVDTSGEVSTAVRVVQGRVLLHHIGERPIFGWGFGTIAPDYPYGSIFSYELSYLDLAYKTGLVGLLLFLTFPLRIAADAIRIRFGRLPPAIGLSARSAAVPLAIVTSVMAAGATNPYFIAAFGLASIIVCLAWVARPPASAPG
jgi:hypothetical protein